MNVDIKILTKLLSIRLQYVLPTIIHESQTAVYGRQIGNNIHLLRDLIDLVNKNNEEACFLFLDQEKAFDRVNHSFLFKVLQQFGFGESFIQWIRVLYANASTNVLINGFLTENIALKSGVRQSCPLSALLYVLVIEILALQLRSNPNIVGFTIQGERIISSHYADDAVIKITQNKCFKEVYKELQDYEIATGARINFEKSIGLWSGKWKNRKDDPFEQLYTGTKRIKWTNRNVKYLGVYVGNDQPAKQTFNEITPKLIKRLNFWKPLRLSVLGKARVIEIFHASKLWYAANFYTIPEEISETINKAFLDYITFPKRNKKQVSRKEMEKLRCKGGLKLINLKLKSQTPKIHWLLRLITDDNLKTHRKIFNDLIGIQRGYLRGEDIIFAEEHYAKKLIIPDSSFYKEAFVGITKLNTFKQYQDINNEHLYYNPIFTTTTDVEVHEKTLTPFQGNGTLSRIKTYGDLLTAETTTAQPRLLAAIRRKKGMIHHVRESVEQNHLYALHDMKEYPFTAISPKIIYAELINHQSTEHVYTGKWGLEIPQSAPAWDEIWTTVHRSFYTEELKSTIWDQLHLNFYTTRNYNKWNNAMQPCPLCRKIPEDIFHIILECKFTKVMWKRIERKLIDIFPKPITQYEQAFGLQPSNKEEVKPLILRNWITFNLRHHVLLEERRAYHAKTPPSVQHSFTRFNIRTLEELKMKKLNYDFRNLASKFQAIVTINNVVASLVEGQYEWKQIM